jgi:hypothetical protein
MKTSLEKFSRVASGYGGMLFIAILGLSVLIFGGIIANARQSRELRASILQLEQARQHQIQLQPFLAVAAGQQRSIQTRKLPFSSNRALTSDEMAGLQTTLRSIATAADLQVISIRPLLQADLSNSQSLRMEIRLLGKFSNLRPFLHELTTWDYHSGIEGFMLQSAEEGQEMQLVIQLAST